jgi:hypothetical protein
MFISAEVQEIPLQALRADLSTNIILALSFLSQDRLIFLSKTFTICTVKLPWTSETPSPQSISLASTSPNVTTTTTTTTMTSSRPDGANLSAGDTTRELFALPGDWVSREASSVCSIWGSEKSLLWPRNGEAAVVKCAALA